MAFNFKCLMPAQTFASQICEINAIFPPQHCPTGSCRLLSAVLRLPQSCLKFATLQLARISMEAHPEEQLIHSGQTYAMHA